MAKKYTKLYILFCCHIFLFSCTNNLLLNETEKKWLQENDSINISLFEYYPPYQFVNEQGKIDGLFVDYLNLIESKIDYKFNRVKYTSWPKLIEDLKSGKSDVILELQETENRRDFLNFYSLNFKTNFVIVTRKDAFYGDAITSYLNKDLVLPEEFGVNEILLKAYPGLKISPCKNDYDCLQLLHDGIHDVYVGPKSIVNHFIKTKNLQNLKIASELDQVYKPGIGVLKKNTMLNAIFKKATSSITSKENKIISDRWFLTPTKPFYLKPIFWFFIFIFISTVLIIIASFNRILKFQVKKKTLQLRISKAQAEESNRFKTNFIHNISHEIRTPMNSIIGFSKLLKENRLSQQQKDSYLNTIITSSKQLLHIVDDLLEISNLQTKRTTIDFKPTDLDKLFQDLESHFKLAAQKKNLKLNIVKNNQTCNKLVYTDASKLTRALSHLIDNAIKFTNKGFIDVTYFILKDSIIITIKDTGIGIKKNLQTRIFNSFLQLEQEISKKHSGLGLGLTLALENIRLLEGTIRFTSEVEKGSVFTINLAYKPVKKGNLTTNKKDRLCSLEITSNKTFTILIAEDVIINFRLLEIMLKKIKGCNFNIIHANNGQEAVTINQQNNTIDLVLMDIRMPIMDGYEATRIIKKLKPKLPIIVQTAYTAATDIEKAFQAGCDDFMPKPIETETLIEKINAFLNIS